MIARTTTRIEKLAGREAMNFHVLDAHLIRVENDRVLHVIPTSGNRQANFKSALANMWSNLDDLFRRKHHEPCEGYSMSAVKEVVRDFLDQLPEETSLEEIQYQLYVREKVEHGLEDVADGRVISQEEAEQRMAKWL